MFPKVPDRHKPNNPLIPNGLGVIYVVVSVAYLFLMYHFLPTEIEAADNVSRALTLAICILFGGFMGLFDDWMDLRWRYKAFFPLIAAIPLVSVAIRLGLRTSVATIIFGNVDFGLAYYFIVIPLIVTVTTNTVNQLGGLNGLETVCPAIVMVGLMLISGENAVLLYVPLLVWLLLAFLNVQGRIFVGNTGSFAIGVTVAAFAIIADVKSTLVVSILPYVLNSSLILLNCFFFKSKAQVSFDGKKLSSNHRRSLVTLVTYRRHLSERQVVAIISLLIAASTIVGLSVQWLAQ